MRFNRFFYKTAVALISTYVFASCNNTRSGRLAANDATQHDTTKVATDSVKPSPYPADIDTSDFAIEYLTIADTGKSYYKLRAEMFELNRTLGWAIDTMGRYYNTKQNKIVLSDTASDEVYRGEYFERRFPSENMSLEYYNRYSDSSTFKNIALVCSLYETRKSADSLLSILKPHAAHAFVLKAKLYMGCEH